MKNIIKTYFLLFFINIKSIYSSEINIDNKSRNKLAFPVLQFIKCSNNKKELEIENLRLIANLNNKLEELTRIFEKKIPEIDILKELYATMIKMKNDKIIFKKYQDFLDVLDLELFLNQLFENNEEKTFEDYTKEYRKAIEFLNDKNKCIKEIKEIKKQIKSNEQEINQFSQEYEREKKKNQDIEDKAKELYYTKEIKNKMNQLFSIILKIKEHTEEIKLNNNQQEINEIIIDNEEKQVSKSEVICEGKSEDSSFSEKSKMPKNNKEKKIKLNNINNNPKTKKIKK